MKVSDEAVEAAAKALWQHGEMPEFGWDQLDRVSKIVSLDEARAALEAAAPHMLAQALDDAVAEFPLETIVAPDNAVVWMMRRAEQIRSQA